MEEAGKDRVYTLPGGGKVRRDGAEVFVLVRELASKLQVDPEEMAEREAAWEAEQKASEERRRRIASIEKARNDHAFVERMREKNEKDTASHVAQGRVEIRRDPGKPFDKRWYDDFVAYRLPELHIKRIPEGTGVLALSYAMDKVEDEKRAGKAIRHPAALVLEIAEQVMRGKRTQWVDPEVAAQNPHLVVKRGEFSGATAWERHWTSRWQRFSDAVGRLRRGLRPRQDQ